MAVLLSSRRAGQATRLLACLGLALGFATGASPATVTVKVIDAGGKPVPDAVVVAELPGSPPMPIGHGYTMLQKDLAFHPFVLIVPVGATVSFPNADNTRHQVYSFSPAKRFELKLFARDQSRWVSFENQGAVALGCNIHDEMIAFIFVTASAWTAKTDENGVAVLPNLPDVAGRLAVWHPYLRAPGNTVRTGLERGQHNAGVVVRLRPAPMRNMTGY